MNSIESPVSIPETDKESLVLPVLTPQERIDSVYQQFSPKVREFNSSITSADWGTIIGTIIGFTPEVGNLLKTGFGLLWGHIFSNNGKYITKDQFDNAMDDLYRKVEEMVDDKLDQDEKNRCTLKFEDCQNRGNNFNDLITIYIERNQVKAGLKVNTSLEHRVEPPSHLQQLSDDNLLEMIRSEFLGLRDSLEGAIIDFSNKLYSHIMGNLLSVTMMMYINLMRDAILQGISWGLPSDYINGTTSVPSLKSKVHDRVIQFHHDLAHCLYSTCYKRLPFPFELEDLPDNSAGVYGRINELDLIEYPLPVVRQAGKNGNFDLSTNKGFKTFKLNIHDTSLGNDKFGKITDTVNGTIPYSFSKKGETAVITITNGSGWISNPKLAFTVEREFTEVLNDTKMFDFRVMGKTQTIDMSGQNAASKGDRLTFYTAVDPDLYDVNYNDHRESKILRYNLKGAFQTLEIVITALDAPLTKWLYTIELTME
ncbi:proteosomal alpha-subunit 7-1 [Heterostelium album PN500]|uniref:Proteosomal alpha-subunit 7-1 n=1 Tax=Heterostelium pallidum (strain ATCC 26659 / Pp 5 / PN500) TaxID=670386 RepID=D3BV72_HETP5|nr:proteosomal alpha-subunit 7-1 [Heterostelium album PN500]EFA74629.1 proteosomal alpha-subunit 7-1 [Heterostelium album PN500]|eukprot:XP_020426763.1 proteosomal alpha-subunit 7-1 [Heterostelium album PN500]